MRKNLTGKARYSSTNKQILCETFTLNPWWVTGFSDAEGSFSMSIFKSKTSGVSRLRIRSKDHIISILVPHFRDYPLEGHKNLQYLAWLKAVTVLTDQIKTNKRDAELEILIKELSSLK